MVWIHGGALQNGESNEFNPIKLVQRGVVVVTINYRLGALGFLAHPVLTRESAGFAAAESAQAWDSSGPPTLGPMPPDSLTI